MSGQTACFMAKLDAGRVGNASHIHQSLSRDGVSAFFDAGRQHGMSRLFSQYLAGLITYARDYAYFLAPYVNSYKRFTKGSFAPTRIGWAIDNRTAAFRLCGTDSADARVECRLPGADANIHLALAAMLAAGLSGIEQELSLVGALEGNNYDNEGGQAVPATLEEAAESLSASRLMRTVFGDEVVEHYVRSAQWESEGFATAVTDYELFRVS